MKLGYSYRVCSGGADSKVVTVNGGAWTNAIDDKRSIWTRYHINDSAIALTFVPEGALFVVSQLLGGARPDDNVTTWIYVPSQVIISGTELLQVIQAVRAINREGTRNVSEATFTSNPVLSREYPVKKYVQAITPATNNVFAYRYPSAAASLDKILSLPFQSYYFPYKFIFIYENPGAGFADIKDISNLPLDEWITILPPSAASLATAFGPGQMTVKLDEKPFTAPVLKKKGEELNLLIEKAGCRPIECKISAITDGMEVSLPAQRQGWLRVISPQMLAVTDAATGRSIPGAQATVYGPDGRRTNQIPEEQINRVDVQVSAPGYDTFKGTVNLSSGRADIRMNRTVEKHTYNYRTKDGRLLKVTIDGVGAGSANPLEGYSVSGDSIVYQGVSQKSKGFAWKEFAIGAGVVIAFGLLYWVGYIVGSRFFGNEEIAPDEEINIEEEIDLPNDSTPEGDGNPGFVIDSTSEASLNSARKYLDENTIWNQEEMNQYPELLGLFDELNTFNLEALKQRRNIQDVPRIAEIIACLETAKASSRKSLPERYNLKQTDLDITIDKYIEYLKKDDANPKGIERKPDSSGNTSPGLIKDQNKDTKKQD